jgi:hypothetical protein
MPNHVTNKIEFYGEKENIKKVLELINGEDECIDFNKIIPTPDNIYQGNLGEEKRRLYGKNNWYDWNIDNWGTKWNAYSSWLDAENNVIYFDTAWSSPTPVLDALAKLCYEYKVSFTGAWADEDRGHNIGIFESDCEGDEYWFGYEYLENCSNEAYDIYVDLKGEDSCMGKDGNGNWVAYSCDTCPNRENC